MAYDILDSRRLTGPNLWTNKPGAVLDARVPEEKLTELIGLWQRAVQRMLNTLGWPAAEFGDRSYPGGVTLAFSAPVDRLYVATEINEWAFDQAVNELNQGEPESFEEALTRFAEGTAEEMNPDLLTMIATAQVKRVPFLVDDNYLSLGLGRFSVTFAIDALPAPDGVVWESRKGIPLAMVTGTNGKSTTVRLLSAMVAESGLQAGSCSTDWIYIGEDMVECGDYSGPGGARQLLRDNRVDLGILETARGGMLRRGLALPRVDVAVVTNVAEDHFGEYGIHDLTSMAQTKLIVAKAIGPNGLLVLNAEDEQLVELGPRLKVPICWFSTEPDLPLIRRHVAAGGDACFVEDGRFILHRGGRRLRLLEVAKAPITLGGAARFNTSNALAAIATASALGLSTSAIEAGLGSFDNTPQNNPGRGNRFHIHGATMIVDFAHNPHGMTALVNMVKSLDAKRKLIILGQAGDRDDDAIRKLATIAWRAQPDLVIIKEMLDHLRGREAGEVPALMAGALRAVGAPEVAIQNAESEIAAIRRAVAWAQPGDLLVLLSHGERSAVLAYLEELSGNQQEG